MAELQIVLMVVAVNAVVLALAFVAAYLMNKAARRQ